MSSGFVVQSTEPENDSALNHEVIFLKIETFLLNKLQHDQTIKNSGSTLYWV